jgi:hypothetical protein
MQAITLTITRNPDGSIGVQGPLNDKVVCYGLLGAARDAIYDMHAAAAKSPIQTVPAGALPFPPRHAAGERS